jgi:hypothetical protein
MFQQQERKIAASFVGTLLALAAPAAQSQAPSGEPLKIGSGISQTGGLAPNGTSALLDLRIALGPPLIATKGYSAPDLPETITRARVLAERLGRSEYLVPLFYGQRQAHLARAEHRLRAEGRRGTELTLRLLGRYLQGFNRICLGEFAVARGYSSNAAV